MNGLMVQNQIHMDNGVTLNHLICTDLNGYKLSIKYIFQYLLWRTNAKIALPINAFIRKDVSYHFKQMNEYRISITCHL